jgi:hypothetical protein
MSLRYMLAVLDPVADFIAISPTQTLVLLCLADNANDSDGRCWPSLESIGTRSRLSERQIRYTLRELEGLGLLESRATEGKTTRYRLTFPAVSRIQEQGGATRAPVGGQPVPPRGATRAPVGGQPVPPRGATRAPGGATRAPEPLNTSHVTKDARARAQDAVITAPKDGSRDTVRETILTALANGTKPEYLAIRYNVPLEHVQKLIPAATAQAATA